MKKGKFTALALCALMLSAGVPQIIPAQDSAYTVSAAEADYDWGGMLKKSADWFGSSEALKIADECIQYQVANEGGWQKGMTTKHDGDWAHSTIDNDATTSQIRFLMRSYAATGQQKYYDCAVRGIDCLFKMQYSNGGYMQCLNTPGTYHAHITLNDGAYVHVMQIMQEMAEKTGDFTKLSDEYAQKAAASLEKAIDCLLKMQITVNGKKTAWCQQHDENNLKPAPARAYELPSICTSESAGVVTFLHSYGKAHPERTDIAESVNAAIEWFKKAGLYGIKFDWNSDKSDKVVTQVDGAGPIWARFYTLDTEKPLFSDRDGGTYYDVMQISQERRTGYAWYGSWGKNVVNLKPLDGQPEVPPEEPKYSGQFIRELTVHDTKNGSNWAVAWKMNVGSKIYGDRDFEITTLPEYLKDAEYVQTACDSKTVSSDLATLTASQPITVYAIVDMRLIVDQGMKPKFLDGFTQTSDLVTSSNTVTYMVYQKKLAADEQLTLTSNLTGQNVVNYFLAVQPDLSAQTTESTAETTQTTETTTETTVSSEAAGGSTAESSAETSSEITSDTAASETSATTETTAELSRKSGDVNVDGSVTVADAVLLARVAAEDTAAKITDQGKANGELDGREGLSADDLTYLLKYLAGMIEAFPDWD
ncbi:MAG: pectate lyase [Oscillospiraceae bacterium]|nr:pectate lyase [Oscillospiraceae bacterium]